MNLSAHIQGRDITAREAATELGISESYLCRLIAGERTPSMAVAAKIKAWSNGAVTADDFMPASSEVAA